MVTKTKINRLFYIILFIYLCFIIGYSTQKITNNQQKLGKAIIQNRDLICQSMGGKLIYNTGLDLAQCNLP